MKNTQLDMIREVLYERKLSPYQEDVNKQIDQAIQDYRNYELIWLNQAIVLAYQLKYKGDKRKSLIEDKEGKTLTTKIGE